MATTIILFYNLISQVSAHRLKRLHSEFIFSNQEPIFSRRKNFIFFHISSALHWLRRLKHLLKKRWKKKVGPEAGPKGVGKGSRKGSWRVQEGSKWGPMFCTDPCSRLSLQPMQNYGSLTLSSKKFVTWRIRAETFFCSLRSLPYSLNVPQYIQ